MGRLRLLAFCGLLAALLLSGSSMAIAHEGHYHEDSAAADVWKCPSCGYASNTGNFCSKCGAAKPGTWTCPTCGQRGNTGNFCSKCGTAKPDPNAAKAQSQSADNGLSINVLGTNGVIDQYRLVNKPRISFAGDRITVGGKSYEQSKVQRLEYGKSSSGSKTTDKPSDQQNAVYIYRHDGKFNAFEQSAIREMSHEIADTLLVALADSVYKIPLAAIDSIGIHPFPTVYNPRVVNLEPYAPYVESVSVEKQSIKFKKTLPEEMKPKQGDILFYETFDTIFPDGYAGRVLTTDGYACSTEIVGIDDIYERVIMFGTLAVKNEPAPQKKASPYLPAPDEDEKGSPETGISVDLSEMKVSVSYGGASASFDVDISPEFNVSTIKRGPFEKAITVVSVGLDDSCEVTLSISGGGSTPLFRGTTLSPMAKIPIPACPVFSVGLDIFPFLDFSVEGSISVSGKLAESTHTTLYYCDGSIVVEGPKHTVSFSSGNPNVKAEGKLYGGLSMFPSIQMTGGILKLGPVLEVGPSIAATLDVNPAGIINTAYEVIKDSKATLAVEGKLKVGVFSFGKSLGASGISFPFTLCSKDWFFVPLFTKPTVSPTRKDNVGVATTVGRDVLFSVPIGIDILQGNSAIKVYEAGEYSGETMIMRQHFSGFEEGATYSAVPTVDIFGSHVNATPTTMFTIEKEEEEAKPQDNPDTQDPPKEEVKQETKNPSGFRFEWKNSNGSHGYFERKDDVFISYMFTRSYGEGITYRYNDSDQTYAEKWDSDPRWWVEDDIFEDQKERSHTLYLEYMQGRQELKEEAGDLWNIFSDALYDDVYQGGLAYFEETFRRHYHQAFGIEGGERKLKADFVGTGTICGVKCNIYDNHKRFQQAKVWVDPETGLCLRYEDIDSDYWFEVTKYEIDDYNF